MNIKPENSPVPRTQSGISKFTTTEKISSEQMGRYLGKISGAAWRCNGFIVIKGRSAISIRIEFGDLTMDTAPEYVGSTELTATGDGVSPDLLRRLFEELNSEI